MSYLDPPRFHFSGQFFSNPSTINNDPANFGPAIGNEGFDRAGFHFFLLQNCKVKTAFDKTGAAAGGDALIGGTVETTSTPVTAKLVDLDPQFQTGSQIWGAQIKVSEAAGGGSVTGTLVVPSLRDLWMERVPGAGFALGFGGAFQSVLINLSFSATLTSSVLRELKVKSPTTLSIKFVLYAYQAKQNAAAFTAGDSLGKIVGSVGPALVDEPAHFLAERRMEGGRSPFGAPLGVLDTFGGVPFKVDFGRGKLVVDLGNSIPEAAPGGARGAHGVLQAVALTTPAITVIGNLDFSQAHYEQTAGIEELTIPRGVAPKLRNNRVAITRSAAGGQLVLAERAVVDVEEFVFRLNPGESARVTLRTLLLGIKKAGQVFTLARSSPRGAAAAGLSFPASVTTDSAGKATITLSASDPGRPRTGLDGQVFRIDVHEGSSATPSTLRARLQVRVFSAFAIPANPTFARDIAPILAPYASLYPGMKGILDIGNLAALRTFVTTQPDADKRTLLLSVPITDPRFMPVTRDLSNNKRDTILRWLAAGLPP